MEYKPKYTIKKPVRITKLHHKKLVKTTKDYHICPAGHTCYLTRNKYNFRFLCKICDARGKFKDGAYVCE